MFVCHSAYTLSIITCVLFELTGHIHVFLCYKKLNKEQLKRKATNLKASGNNVHCVSCLLFLLSFVSQVNCMDVNTVRHIIMFIIIAFEISNRL